MPAELALAARYLFGLGRRTHVATVTAISLIGLTLGVLSLVVTLALLEGFQSTIRAEVVKRSAHARVASAEGRLLEDPETLARRLHEGLGDVDVEEVVRGSCLVSTGAGSVPARIVGRSGLERVAVDRVLAARLAVGPGEQLLVLAPRSRLTPLGPVPVRVRLTVGTVVPREPGGSEGGVMLVPLATAQRLLWGRPVVEALELRDPGDPWGLAARVRRALGEHREGLRVQGLAELHRPLFLALTLERSMIFLAVGLMLVVAALNLLCNVAMVAAEKRQDMAVLAGLGLPPARLRRLFLVLGLMVGAAATVLGAAAGTALATVLDATQALPLPRGVFAVSAVPFSVRPATVAAVVVFSMALSAAAAWAPARSVARREPAEGLRYE